MTQQFPNHPADPTALPTAVLAALPTWANYLPYGGECAALLRGGTFTIPVSNVAAARGALSALPADVAEDVFDSDWCELDLAGALCAWGWGARTTGTGDVLVGGTYAEAVTPSQFAALLTVNPYRAAVAPWTPVEPWVFAAPRTREPAFAISFATDRLELSTDVDAEVHYLVS